MNAADRAAERYRRAAWGALATAAARLAGVGLILVTVAWAAPQLGAERFGVWATFSGFTLTLSFLDLGIGNALVNRVAHVQAGGDHRALLRVVMGGLGWLALIGLAVSAALAIAAAYIPWASLFKLSGGAQATETLQAALVFSALFGLNLVAVGALKILTGQQRLFEAQFISMLAALLAYPATWAALHFRDSLSWLLLAGLGTQAAVILAAAVGLLAARRLFDLRGLAAAVRAERGPLLSSGGSFFVIQVGTAIGWGSDTLILAAILGAREVAAYAIAQRLFLFASQPVVIGNGALWAAYADAHARDDRLFIRSTLQRALALSVAAGVGLSAVLLSSGVRLAELWTGNAVEVGFALLAVFALWTPLEAAGTVVGYYLNGMGILREQVVVVSLFCVLALPAKIGAAFHAGAPGLVAATAVTYAITHIGLYGTVFRRRLLAPLARHGPPIHSQGLEGAALPRKQR